MKYMSLFLTGCALTLAVTGNAQVKKKPATAAKKTAAHKSTATSASAASGKFQKGPNDLQYKVIKHGTGTLSPKLGDIITLRLKQHIDDSLIVNSDQMNMGKPFDIQVQPPQAKGDLMEGLLLMKEGDSTVFRTSLDTMINRLKQPRPDWPKKTAMVIWDVKLLKIKSKAEVEAEQQKMQAEAAGKKKAQADTDDKLIQEYLKQKGIANAQKTPSGLYYVVTKEGSGPKAAAGQNVTVNYTGINIKGEKFDSNVDPDFHHVEPFKFDLGAHRVIAGWDEGVALMNKGMKATFFIPSGLAYGEQARAEKIPANAILIFDIELLDFN